MNTPRNVTRLGDAMDARRRELGLSWADIANGAGITVTTVNALRRGENQPTAKTARGIDRALRWQWNPSSTLAVYNGGDPVPLPTAAEDDEDADIARIEAMTNLSRDAKDVIIDRIRRARDERRQALAQAEELNARPGRNRSA